MTWDHEVLGLLSEALEIIHRDKLEDHFPDDWRARAEELVYPQDADETGPTAEEAQRILAKGFRDASGYYLTETGGPLSACGYRMCLWTAMTVRRETYSWKSRLPLTEQDLAHFEWIEDGKRYREWLVPAAIVNPRMKARIVREGGRRAARGKHW